MELADAAAALSAPFAGADRVTSLLLADVTRLCGELPLGPSPSGRGLLRFPTLLAEFRI